VAWQICHFVSARGNEWLREEIEGWVRADINIVVCLLTSQDMSELGLADESRVAGELGIEFISYPIPDYDVPLSSTTFQALIRKLSALIARDRTIVITRRLSFELLQRQC
jgi:hypothetical protein